MAIKIFQKISRLEIASFAPDKNKFLSAGSLAILKNHWVAILLAFILGLLMVWPFFYFQSALGPEYRGVLNEIIDDELFYMARIKDILDGHPFLGNAYLFEHKNQLPQQLFLPEWLLAQPLKFFNLDVVQGRILYNFILPTFAFILTYFAFYLIYPSRFWAGLFAVFLFFGLYLFKFTRPVIPQFVFLFWLTHFIFLWKLIESKSFDILEYQSIFKNKILLMSILNFGLLFYIYPFYWTFYLVFLVVLSFLFFFREKILSNKFLTVLLGGLLIGSVYFYLNFLASQLPEYRETLTRLQLVFSRSPSGFKIVLFSLAVLAIFGILLKLKSIRLDKETLFFLAGIFSIIVVTNQNILTGRKFEFSSHYYMLAVFFLVFAVYYLFSKFKDRLFRFGPLILLVAAFSVFNGVSGFLASAVKVSDQNVYAQNYKAIFDWLNENTPKDSVVYAYNNLSELIPVYTANNVFYSRAANLFLMPDSEVKERFILNNFFEKFDRDFVIKNERSIWGVRYIDRYGDAAQANKWRRLIGLKLKDETRLPEEEINKILVEVSKVQKNSFTERFKKYKADYFVWDRIKNPDWLIPDSFEKIYETNQFAIFEFN